MASPYDQKDYAGSWSNGQPAPALSHPTQPLQFGSQQPTYGAQVPQHQWGPPPPQQQHPTSFRLPSSVSFRFSGDKRSVLNCTVADPSGRTVLRSVSDKKTTTVYGPEERVVLTVDWKGHGHPPVMHYHGSECRVMDWIPVTKEKNGRCLSHNGRQYTWVEENKICVLQSSPGHNLAVWNDLKDYVEVEVLPEGLQAGIIEPTLLSVMLMQSGRPIGDIKQSGFSSWLPAIGGAIGTLLS